jgi:RNA polymerase sigma-70 factor (ECF subfamily)
MADETSLHVDSEEALRAIVATGRAAWPTIRLDPATFIGHLANLFPSKARSVAELGRLPIADLYLACACAHGDPTAIALFERRCIALLPAMLPGALRQAFRVGGTLDDVMQAVREKLLLAQPGSHPKIAEYAGTGDLVSWVRVVAVRTALNTIRGRRPRELDLDDRMVFEIGTSEVDAELRRLKGRFRADFADAFRGALSTLPARERNVLRQHYIDGLSMDRIAGVYRVHRITVVRWIQQARATLERETRARLAARLRLSRAEVDSVLRLIRSDLDVSLRTHLS